MRILKLRISKSFMISNILNASLVFGMIGLSALYGNHAADASDMSEMGDMGSFIEKHIVLEEVPEDLPVGGLGKFLETLPEDSTPVIVIPVPGAEMREAKLSDGKFETLSPAWKRGVHQVVQDERCRKVAKAFTNASLVSPLLQEAHAIVESNCDPKVIGAAGEIGIFQVMPSTCKDIGVRGDYRDPRVSAQCTEKYRQMLCKTSKKACTAKLMFLAHNRGITGAQKIVRAEATEYLRKMDCAQLVLRGKRCA